jgi:hypothetical protein
VLNFDYLWENGGFGMKRVMFFAAFAGAVALALTTGCATGKSKCACASGQPKAEMAHAFTLRINCGAIKPWTDPMGNTWEADRDFKEGSWGAVGGDVVDRGEIKIDGTDMAPIYRTEHYDMSAYKITCPPGKYKVTLHFAETFEDVQNAGERVFAIAINDKEVVSDMDAVQMAGKPHKAVVKTFEAEAPKGMLVISFTPKKGNSAEINGIEVIQQP